MTTEKIIKKARALEDELNKYYKETDGCEVPDVDTTIIGSGGTIHYTFTDKEVVRTEKDSRSNYVDSYKISEPWQIEELNDQLAYDRRRLRKGWRVWKSENPDAELARDDD